MARPSEKTDLLQGTLDLLILQVAALGPVHGYAIAQRLNQISKEALQVQQGSLYPALYRLETQGLIASEWGESENNRRAKFYTLTAPGKKRLREETDDWNRLAAAMAAALRATPDEV